MRLLLILICLAIAMPWAAAQGATPPVPTQPTTSCDAIIGGKCWVDGPFTLTASSPGADHYRVCRSNDVTSWGGCSVVINSQSGPSLTVNGSHLPSEGARRAYRYRACDAQQNCSAYGPPIYVHLDSTPPPPPSAPITSCDATLGGNCWINGPFTLTASSPGADHYRVCRSNDVTTWGGCSVVISSNSGPSLTVNGSHLPSEGARRAYRYRACDALQNCSAYSPALYTHLDSIPPVAPALTVATGCDAQLNSFCQVTDSFEVSTLYGDQPDTDRLELCRSQDTTGNGICSVLISSNSGPSFPILGSHLPANNLRRAYYFRACDEVNNCSPWAQNTPAYVYRDTSLLQCPDINGALSEALACSGSISETSAPVQPAQRSSDEIVHEALGKSLTDYSLHKVELAGLQLTAESVGEVTLPIAGALHRLVLEPVVLTRATAQMEAINQYGEHAYSSQPDSTYRGFVAGEPDSDVRLLVHPELVMGYVELNGTRYFIDPAYKFEPGGGSDRLVIYEESSVLPGEGISCALTELEEHAEKLVQEDWKTGLDFDPRAKGVVQEVEIATEADYEYWFSHQLSVGATNAHILGIINMINGFYSAVDLSFTVVNQRVFTSANDPYVTCNIVLQWCEMYQEWERFRTTISRDVAYLFSGKRLFRRGAINQGQLRTRGTSGFNGTICAQPTRAYVVSNQYREVGLVAHELGHALNANHDSSGCTDSDCGKDECEGSDNPPGGGTVMCGPIQSPVTGFSAGSIHSIDTFVGGSGGSCLSPVP